jgi:hypothetical protein
LLIFLLKTELVYIKYTKASSAALALEEMNDKCFESNMQCPLKVYISNSKSELANNQFENEIHLHMQRLFIVFEKNLNREDINNAFKVD